MTPKIRESLNGCLVEAVQSENFPETQRLLADGADPNCRGGPDKAQTVLEIAIRRSDETISLALINALMDHGADPNLTSKNVNGKTNATPFMVACLRGKEAVIAAMMDSDGPIKVDWLTPDQHQWIPSVAMACSSSTAAMIKAQALFEREILLQSPGKNDLAKGHLWLSVDERGRNAFMHSDSVGNKQWIIDQNFIDPEKLINAPDHSGKTALWMSVCDGNQKCVDFLLSHGANLDITSDGETLMARAKSISTGQASFASKNILSQLQAVNASRQAMAAINEIVDLSSTRRSTPP